MERSSVAGPPLGSLAFLASGVVAAVAYAVAGNDGARAAVYCAVALSAAVTVDVVVLRRRLRPVRAWRVLAAGVTLLVASDVTLELVALLAPQGRAGQSVGDAVMLTAYVLLSLGIVMLAPGLGRTRDRDGVLDAAILAAGIAVVAYPSLARIVTVAPGTGAVESGVHVVYLLGDVLLIAVLCRLLALGAWRQPAFALLAGGMLALLVADLVSTAQTSSLGAGVAANACWILSYALVGAAVVHPSAVEFGRSTGGRSPDTKLLALVGAAALCAPLVVVADASRHVEVPIGQAVLAVVLVALVLVRYGLVVRSLDRSRRTIAGNEARFRALTENTFDLVAVLDLAGKPSYVSESVERLLGYTPAELEQRTALDLVHPRDSRTVRRAFLAEASGSGAAFRFECRLRHADGGWRTFETVAQDMLAEPSVNGVVTVSRDVTERREAELRLERSEERFRTLVQQSFDVLTIVDEGGDVLLESDSVASTLGYRPSDLVGSSVFDRMHPEDADRVRGIFRGAIERREHAARAEYRMRHRDGSWRILESVGRNLLDNPAVAGVMITSRDVTDRRASEDALRESERRFRSIFENAPLGIAVQDLDGRLVQVNPELCRILGYESEELVGLHFDDITDPADAALNARGLELSLSGRPVPTRERRFVRKDGSTIWGLLHASLVTDAEGRPRRIVLQLQDVTERREAAGLLRRSEERFRVAFDNAPVGIGTLDLDGRITWANPALTKLLAAEQAELEGLPFELLFRASDAATDLGLLAELEQDGVISTAERRVIRSDGTGVWVELSVATVRDPDGSPRQFVFQMLDVTARLEAEAERVRLLDAERAARTQAEAASRLVEEQNELLRDADALKDELISIVSHDLRTPLTSIVGYLEVVRHGDLGEVPPEQDAALEVVERNAGRLRALIDDLLFLSHAESGALEFVFEPVDVVEVAEEAVVALWPQADAAGIALVLDAGEVGTITADRLRIAQLCDNLLTNALKFTPPGGSVTLRVEPSGGGVAVSVSDTGVGIESEDQRYVFDRFFRSRRTRSAPGVGLGLAIAKAIVDAHEGTITVESRAGGGTTFRVELPAGEAR